MSAADYWFDRAEAAHGDRPVVQPVARVRRMLPGQVPARRVYVARRKRMRMAKEGGAR